MAQKLTYSYENDAFMLGKKVLDKSHKSFDEHFIPYILAQVSAGKSVNSLVPLDSIAWPDVGDIISKLTSPDYSAAFEQAKESRREALQERMVYLQDQATKGADAKKKAQIDEELKNIVQTLKNLPKKKDSDAITYNINFHSSLPKGFWKLNAD